MRDLSIAGRLISDDSPYVVAELGSNHGGSIVIAHLMIDAAAQAGVSAVKLQKRDLATFLTPVEHEAPYENEHSYGRTYGEHRAALELSVDVHQELRDHAHRLGLAYGCTAFDAPSAYLLTKQVGVDFVKVASGLILNGDLLEVLWQQSRPVLVSTGGAELAEIAPWARYWGFDDCSGSLVLLQCTSLYPCPPRHLNLRAITTLRKAFPDTVIGFSDHQDGIDMAAVAYMLGARIFEKHFTLDHTMKGTDHAMSLEPAGMAAYVRTLSRIPDALGDGIKRLLPEEIPALRKQGRRDFGDD